MEGVPVSSALLVASVVLFAIAMPLLAYIMLSERIWNLHKVWDLALSGHRLSRWYTAVVVLSFVLAAVSCIVAIVDSRVQKSNGASAVQLSTRSTMLALDLSGSSGA